MALRARQPPDDRPSVQSEQGAGCSAHTNFLRLKRQGGRIKATHSPDGKDWREFKPVATTWATGEIQVGVIAVNTSTGPHPVTFEGYSLKAR